MATSVIIYDCTATEIEDGGIDQDANYITKAIVDENTMTVTVKALPTATDKTAAVISSMRAAGYTDISVSSGSVTGYKDSVQYTFTIAMKNAYQVTFDIGATAASYGNTIVGNKTVYMAAGDSVIVTISGGGWMGVTPTITGTNLRIDKDGDKTVKVTANAGFNAAVASAEIDF